ncbi:cytochrome c-type biogenesis protein [Acuticoccus kandeliae]|uniref:cytochrome c-type biogenesis protein n=1 Tax=Acuticoccus kandeliae TaxID=2073160 RepID=UPI000D3E5A98|nr:cytochrome c-type biogenesis protein [Acuticoccus kandeliae]
MRRVLLLALALLVAAPAFAANPDEMLSDPALEARAREISQEVRCLVCQNQSIDASDAELARDLRILVRERVSAGDTNEEVLNYLTDRYGAFVRLRPPFTASTLLLWGAPLLIVIIALGAGGLYLRSRRQPAADVDARLTEAEEAELAALLAERDKG